MAAPLGLVLLVVTRVGHCHPLTIRLPNMCRRGVAKGVNIRVEGLKAGFVELYVGLSLPRAPSCRATGHHPGLTTRWQGLPRRRHRKRELVAVPKQEATARTF